MQDFAAGTGVRKGDWAAMGRFLTDFAARNGGGNDGAAGPGAILFTYLFRGFELVWRTPCRIVRR